ncbi:NAD(P)H-dependent oxidoreductase [Ensifer sp. ENS06]|uniref:NAD(P)H-dependent oxidoreductase n=1 Tax=Ensifer sp. ENS06 TaxID=2769276 RepID=UPI000DE0BB5A|nr:NAD(P)H-dependent oxidoreductase [Ensifer sp. ENS06]MBD9626327.1 NAD(P)H-dependent oxidoreductase [Ensifer sp. ENS06]
MSNPKLVGFVGSYNRPSSTRALVEEISQRAATKYSVDAQVYDLGDLGPSLGSALSRQALAPAAELVLSAMLAADVLIIGTPTYKGSYPGLFKHLIDLIEPEGFYGKPVILCATGGGDRHSLVVEHQLRPLFGFLRARTLPTAIYASAHTSAKGFTEDFALDRRITDAVNELAMVFPPRTLETAGT